MISCIVLCYMTPIGREVFSLAPLTIKEWVMAGAFTALSWPLISITVKGARVVFKENSKVQMV